MVRRTRPQVQFVILMADRAPDDGDRAHVPPEGGGEHAREGSRRQGPPPPPTAPKIWPVE
ncbi:hypothetical protein J2S22_000474 [Rhodoplanes tepidamans]|nr:hypothetical protein [Rhodoplanes tepidamans]